MDEPSDIKWENLEVTSIEKTGRKIIVYLILLLTMFITFIIIVLTNIVKQGTPSNCTSETITYLEALNNSSKVSCYCKDRSFYEIQNDKVLKEFCWDTYVTLIYYFMFTVIISLVIILVNMVLKTIIIKLGRFMRYSTNT